MDGSEEKMEKRIREIKELLSEIADENKVVMDRTRIRDIRNIITGLESERDRFRSLSDRLAEVSADSAELCAELDEKNSMLSKVTARSAELVAELELKRDALQEANKDLARANAHASELMAEIEIKNDEIGKLNRALAGANANAAEILAELEESREDLKNTRVLMKKEGFKLKTYLDVASVMFVVIGRDGRINLINPKGCEVLGYSEKELIGRDWFEIAIPERSRKNVKTIFGSIINGELEGSEYVESGIVRSDGKSRTIAWHNSYIRDEEGNIISTVSSGEDITGRIELNRELKEREEQYRMLAENQADVVLSIDLNGDLTYVSPAIRQFGGYEPEEEIGRNMIEYLADPDDINKVIPLIERTIKENRSSLVEIQYKPKEGKPFPVEVSGSPYHENGEIKGLQCVMRDIRSRKEVERGLKFQKDLGEVLMSSEVRSDGIDGALRMMMDYTGSIACLLLDPGKDGIRIEGKRYLSEEMDAIEKDPELSELFHEVSGSGQMVSGRITDLNMFKDQFDNCYYHLFPISFNKESRSILLAISPEDKRIEGRVADIFFSACFTLREYIRRMKAKEEEAMSKKNLELALEGGELGLWYLEVNSNRLVQDGRLFGKLGYDDRNIRTDGEFFYSRILEEDRKPLRKAMESIVNGERDQADIEVRMLNSSGGISWINIKGKVTRRDEKGGPIIISGTHQDITARKDIENALTESEERYRNIFETSNLGIYRSSPDGKVLLANIALARMLGYDTVEDLKRRDIEEEGYHDSETRNSFKRRIEKEGKISGRELVWRKKNGENLFVNEDASCVRDEEGNVIFYEGMVEDITERKRAEEALINSQRQMEIILENVQSGIMIIDAEDRIILDANPKALDIIGIERDDMIGRVCHEFICPAEKGNCPISDLGCDIDTSERELINCRNEKITILKTVSEVDLQGRRMLIESFVDMTEQKKMREELQEEKERFESITSSAQDAIVMIDNEGHTTFWNDAAERIFGYSKEEVMGGNFHRLIAHSEHHEAHFRAFEHFKETGEGAAVGKTVELKGLKKDGTAIPVELSLSGILKRGEWHAIGILRDISERKKGEQMIKESEEKLSTFMSSATDAFILLNSDLDLVMANNPGLERFDLPPEEAIGKNITDLVPLVKESESHDAYIKVLETGEPYFIEELIPEWKPGMEQFSLKTFKAGEGLGIIISNITPLKEAKHEIDKQKIYLEELFESSPEAICILDPDDRISRINRGFTRLFQYRNEEARGRRIVDLVVPDGMEDDSLVITGNVAEGETIYLETFRRRKDGSVVDVSILGTPIRMGDRLEAVYAIYRDISDQKRAEREMEEARKKAEEATRMKSEFLANMSHEIRTPMNAILGFSEILNNKIEDPSMKEYASAISTGGKTLLRLINDILDLSKIEAGKIDISYQRTDINSLMEEMEKLFRVKVEKKGLNLVLDLDPGIPGGLLLDEVRIRQILLNLIGNATKFTEKGAITLKSWTSSIKGRDDRVKLHISVTDTGMGIPEDEKERIFGMFDQIRGQDSSRYGGTGLGLTITRKLVKIMNGDIRLRSKVGEGSTFHITFTDVPVVDGEHTEGLEKSDPEEFVFNDSSILVVDDVPSNMEIVKGFLEGERIEISTASDGKEGLKMISDEQFDLILMDIKMPVLDGMEALKEIRKDPETAGMPVVALTASIRSDREEDLISMGFDSILLKPFTRNELLKVLADHLPHETIEIFPEDKDPKDREDRSVCFHSMDEGEARMILLELTRELEEPLTKAIETSSMESMTDVSMKLMELGRKVKNDPILAMGESLRDSIDSFDIDSMTAILRETEGLIVELKEISNEEGGTE